MRTVEAIEAEIAKLPREELYRLAAWIKSRLADEWDKQIEEDAKAGKLDIFASEALEEFRGQRRCHRGN